MLDMYLLSIAPSAGDMCATLNGNEITGSLLYLDRRPAYGIAVIFLTPAEPEKAVTKWMIFEFT